MITSANSENMKTGWKNKRDVDWIFIGSIPDQVYFLKYAFKMQTYF